jgi:exosortase
MLIEEKSKKEGGPQQTSVRAGQSRLRSAAVTPTWRTQLLILAVLALVLYAPIMKDLVSDWWNDPDYTHGFLVPVVVAFVLWAQRRRLAAVAVKPALIGLPIMIASVALLVGGKLAADYFTSRVSLCILLVGMVVYLAGWRMLRALTFPLSYLTLMIPLPGIIYNQVTFPMQLLASRIAAGVIELTGIPVFREGNLLHVPHFSVEVAQACSGIRSFLSLLALALGYAYFADRRNWLRFCLVCVMIPIAILTNAVRITITTLLGFRFGEQWSEGFTHLFSGWLIYLAALALMFAAHALIKKAMSTRVWMVMTKPAK